MKVLATLGLLGGLALTIVVAQGAGDVWRAAAALGWSGLAILVVLRLVLGGGMGLAWWVLGHGRADAALGRFIWGRLLRDAAGDTLPLSQLGGYVVGARAAALAGVSGGFAAASTLVDVTLEQIGQLAYILIGLGLLAWLRPGTGLVWPALGAVAGIAALLTLFVALQARGAGAVERLSRRMAGTWFGLEVAASEGMQAAIAALYRRRGRGLLSATLHFGCWVLSGVDVWIILRLIGIPRALSAGLVIDSLLFGLRSLAFLVPSAVGVQEAGFILFGSLFGIPADAALALSLIRRARDLIVHVPALLVWQILEGRHALCRLSSHVHGTGE